ncbi:MAG: glycosyl hydrolase, partial [Planctomycetota bacterium]
DPHHVCLSASHPDRLWQQNHCGIYRMDREEGRWMRVGENMPEQVGDIGFPILLHPRDPDTVWVFPMDGSDVWPRTSPQGKPAVYRTRDAGTTWERQDRGFPRENAHWTVKRQCMAQDAHDPLGLYLGTSSGEIWGSTNEGRSWKCLARHLPHVYSLEVLGSAP